MYLFIHVFQEVCELSQHLKYIFDTPILICFSKVQKGDKTLLSNEMLIPLIFRDEVKVLLCIDKLNNHLHHLYMYIYFRNFKCTLVFFFLIVIEDGFR